MDVNTVKYKIQFPVLLLRFCAGMLFYFSVPALAFDAQSIVNFNVSGTITEPSCEVQIKPSDTIELGTVSYQHLTNKPGAYSDDVPLGLEFTECSRNTASVNIVFKGNPFSESYPMIHKSVLVNSGGARDVGLQLLSKADQVPLGNNVRYTFALTGGQDTQQFDMIARMYTPRGQITAGNVLYSVTFEVTYK